MACDHSKAFPVEFGTGSVYSVMPIAENTQTNVGLVLPLAPATETGSVKAWQEPVTMQSYLPAAPDRNPMFLERRVYQGSSGRVYPLPFIDRIATEPVEHAWQAVHIENEFLRLMILPEIGGRIHVGLDKRNGYDFFYRQNVIKPALVGLAGPWISGGVEFNWPQHHRPATFMPVEIAVERENDGSVTVWCSDHDPMTRMKGMHGVCLHPDRAYVELKVRLYNRTPWTQTFLWWANAAVRVHEKYQSFFPADVRSVADHAKRAVTSFPRSDGAYYGVDYPERARSGVPADEMPAHFVSDGSYAANDLSWYANIPVPTSYMIVGTEQDFFGGYDHLARAGLVHVADHRIAPGKKQWTWGNHEFGYAWDRCLTDNDGPYIELMAGVYTDNQPDFSFLAPWETKTFSQYWYPIREIGPACAANLDAAASLRVVDGVAQVGICVTHEIRNARVMLERGGERVGEWAADLSVSNAFVATAEVLGDVGSAKLSLRIEADGREILRYDPPLEKNASEPVVATEPGTPEEIASNDELYLTGLHLEQYRHATRKPEVYWQEALRRDASDARCNNALGLWRLKRGEFAEAERHFRAAIARLTRRNPNPQDGEPYYNLGLTLQFQGRDDEAYAALAKAAWNSAWGGPAHHAMAEIDGARGAWNAAFEHVERVLSVNTANLNVRNLRAMILRKLGREGEAAKALRDTARIDPLDAWSRYLISGEVPKDNQRLLDMVFDLSRAGFRTEALDVLQRADLSGHDGSVPMVFYAMADLLARTGDEKGSAEAYRRAAETAPEYCFPSRLEDLLLLEKAIATNPDDARAPYYLGNWFCDRRRYEEAIAAWERAADLDASFPTAWRNLGIAYYNVRRDAAKARDAFELAFAGNQEDARVLYECDQLWKCTGEAPERRLAELQKHRERCDQRDDLTVELATLVNQAGEPERALEILLARKFQPWEGGEGLVLSQFARANLLLGQRALAEGDAVAAQNCFETILRPPQSLGEAKHLLANQSEVWFWIGVSHAQLGLRLEAEEWWARATHQRGDFREMSVRTISEMNLWSAMAYKCLGKKDEAAELLQAIFDHSVELERTTAEIDYFATSLPAMLLFEEDLERRNKIEAFYLRGQALFGMGKADDAKHLLGEVLLLDRNHGGAADLLKNCDLLRQAAGLA
jgi:tetratricopeptide (TPR) repeat protein